MEKSPEAFRTISEVADWLGVPTHVLRFWESRFAQVKPVKRAGGRRYYRPSDMALLGGIKRLLHDDGMTIRGVQKLLREEGVKHVAGFSQPLDSQAEDESAEVARDVTPAEAPAKAAAARDDDASPMAVDVEPEPLDNVVPMIADEDEAKPQLSFLKRDERPAPAASAAPPELAPDLFTSRRSAPAAADAAPVRRIPATPDVPAVDPEDDDAHFVAGPGMAARVLAAMPGGLRFDRKVIAGVVAGLKDLRDHPRA